MSVPSDDRFDLWTACRLLAARPECVHHLNGPCNVCGPSLSLDQTVRWLRELRDLGVIDDAELRDLGIADDAADV
jgi:hypothetical protein